MLNWWLPENVSTYGRDIDWLFHLIYWITGITFILVAVTLIAFIVVYRDRPGRRAAEGAGAGVVGDDVRRGQGALTGGRFAG